MRLLRWIILLACSTLPVYAQTPMGGVTGPSGGGSGISEVGGGSQRSVSIDNVPTVIYAGSVTSGNLLVCEWSIFNSVGTPVAGDFTDTVGTTFDISLFSVGSNRQLIIWGAAAGSGANTVTLATHAGAGRNGVCDEFTGQNATQPDAQGTGTTGTSTTPSDSITTANANALVLNSMSHEDGGSPSITAGSGYTLIGKIESTTNQPTAFVFKIVTTATAYTPDFTVGASVNWLDKAVSIRP